MSSSQSFVSLAVGFVGTCLRTSSCVFGSCQTSFGFFGYAAATGSQNCGQSQSREFQNVVHRVHLQGILFKLVISRK
ncbi:Mannose or cellobiose epimerase [Pseudomonas syringae pv. actinidiae]|uniref:Mannose or cellobiose epimerase n=1 Tax=Pseudomonas syringae pv. actinidiae TaxID=103796 RepID=A0A2V0QQW5_PSESF|nr:Mannose or cellobiose epimerase [Pseudomonas syringae pv. actinidiae]